MTLSPKDFHTHLEYETYNNTKNWSAQKWSDFRNNFCTDYYKKLDYANSLINNKEKDNILKKEGVYLMLQFNQEKLKAIKTFNTSNYV